jgi:hypothetical protein
MPRPSGTPLWMYIVGFVALLVCGCGGSIYKANYHEHVAECTITDKDRTSRADSSKSSARIYTKQCGVLSNEDMLLRGKTESADIQGQLQVGHTYRLRIVGWRFGLTSSFPNILAVEGEVQG